MLQRLAVVDNANSEYSYIRQPEIVVHRMGNAAFLANQQKDTLFSLNELGYAIWKMLAEPRTPEQVVEILMNAFPEADEVQIRKNIVYLFTILRQNGLITPAED